MPNLTEEQLANKLNGNTFFNKEWLDEQISNNIEEAYNKVKNSGKCVLEVVVIGEKCSR